MKGVYRSPLSQILVRRPPRSRHFCRRSLWPGRYMGYVGRSAGTWGDVGPKFGLGGSNVPIFTKRFTNLQYFTMNYISKWSPLIFSVHFTFQCFQKETSVCINRVCHRYFKHVLWSSLKLILYRISRIFRIWLSI